MGHQEATQPLALCLKGDLVKEERSPELGTIS